MATRWWRRQRGSARPTVLGLDGDVPRVDPGAWIAPTAAVVGNVTLAAEVSVYYGASVRAEGALAAVGEQSNIQDNAVLHAGLQHHLQIGSRVTIGHGAIVHGCSVGDEALIGMGSILLNDCQVGARSLVAAGSLVPERARIPSGVLAVGRPARVVRELSEQEQDELINGAAHYVDLLDRHRAASSRRSVG